MKTLSADDASPAEVQVTGWRVGAQTVSAIQVIQTASQTRLADAKELVEKVLSGVPVIVNVADAESARRLVAALEGLKFDCHLMT